MNFPCKIALVAIVAALTSLPCHGGDIVFLDAFRMFADRSTLMVEIGSYEGQVAMKVSFGHGLASKDIGLVFKEKIDPDNQKLGEAFQKLAGVLNDPKRTLLRLEHELSADIGLTFQKVVKADQIQ